MLVPALLFLSAVTVRDSSVLRDGCLPSDSNLATLPAGLPVEIRFAIADGSGCYKIAATLAGRTVTGYVPGAALAGLDQFEHDRRAGSDPSAISILRPSELLKARPALASAHPAGARAAQLLEANQPAKALETLEPALARTRDPDLLYLAGLSAYRNDQIKTALGYWRQSLDLRPNEPLARLYGKVEREDASDRSSEKLYGMRVILRYEGETVPPALARSMIAILDEELTRISSVLGCPAEERVIAIVQSRQAYLKTTDAAEWSGGQYDGRIHVSLPESAHTNLDMRRVFAHEIVHACLTNISPLWPAWFHEGLAQKLSGDSLSAGTREQVRQLAAAHAIPRLENMGQAWSRMSAQHARIAYGVALAAAELLMTDYSSVGIRNLVSSPEQLPTITAALDRRLGL